jgi:hypothetical protein
MPGQDRMGPRGQGPRTGWGAGLCGGQADRGPGFAGRGWGGGGGRGRGMGQGRGRGSGRGWGRGLGRWFGGGDVGSAPLSDDPEALRAESSRLKAELEAVEDRLSKSGKTD